jgi:hypothetical protein
MGQRQRPCFPIDPEYLVQYDAPEVLAGLRLHIATLRTRCHPHCYSYLAASNQLI